MPFFKTTKYFIGKDCVSLQVQKPQKYNNKEKLKLNCRKKRVCLFTSKGSLTVEAAIIMTLFMVAILFIESFIIMVHVELAMQIHINNVVKSTAKKAFYIKLADEITDSNQEMQQFKSMVKESIGKIDNETEDVLRGNIDKTYLMAQFVHDTNINTFGPNLFFGGIAGINIAESKIENGNIDMVLTYRMKVLFWNYNLPIKQRAIVKDWTGCDITEQPNIVYITKTGKVYHTSKECKYLNLKIKMVPWGQIELLRNQNGGKYKKCGHCGKTAVSKMTIVYITDDGGSFHTTLECQGLKRNIIPIDILEIKEREPCSNCGKEK